MRIIDGFKDARPNGYLESIRKGSAGVSRFRGGVYYGSGIPFALPDRKSVV